MSRDYDSNDLKRENDWRHAHGKGKQAEQYSLEDLKIASVFANEAGKVISNLAN